MLDPLVMSLIYWFVFTQVFQRTVGHEPYIVFLITALLPWVWFNAAVSDFTRAFSKDARLVRSTAIPRSIWVNRIVLSKGIEFLCSLPVLVLFAILAGAPVGWGLLWFPVAIAAADGARWSVSGCSSRRCACSTPTSSARPSSSCARCSTRRPIIYGVQDLPGVFRELAAFNPLSGIFTLYRVGFFPEQWDTFSVVVGALMSFAFLGLGRGRRSAGSSDPC